MKFIRFNQLEVQSSLEYWTDERIASAIPDPLLHIEIPEEIEQKENEFSKVETEMFLWSCGGSSFAPSYPVRVNVERAPYNKAGKLYYTKNGKPYSATAQFVESPSILLTAAHCLKIPGSHGVWAKNIVFRRADIDKVAPQTMNIAVNLIGVHENWDLCHNKPTRVKWDYAFAQTDIKSNVGYLLLSTELPKFIKAIGYTANYGKKTKYMCEAKGFRGRQIHGRVHMLGNPMNDGSSGGAWLSCDRHEVVGLNAQTDDEGNMYGPIFDYHTIELFDRMIGFWHSCPIL